MDHEWNNDFIFDQTDDGGRLKWLPILDKYSRDLMSLGVARSMTAEDVIDQRGIPQFIRSYNGLEFVAKAVRKWIKARGYRPCSGSLSLEGFYQQSRYRWPL